MQALEPGWNVPEDVKRFGVTPFHFDDKMVHLYEQGNGFIFGSLVFRSRPAPRLWIAHALDRIRLYADRVARPIKDLKILMFGDGPGNDSLFLAKYGCKVDYYKVPGSKTYNFALRRFQHYGLWERDIRPIYDYDAFLNGQYDVVLSFEVLEHLSEPVGAIQGIHAALRVGGIALITEDFGNLVGYLPPHLPSSARYRGAAPFLFLKNHMVLSWYSQDELFKPREYVKREQIAFKDWLMLARDRNVRRQYLDSRVARLVEFIYRLSYARVKGL
jgi:SAM-dependent methyltransferase